MPSSTTGPVDRNSLEGTKHDFVVAGRCRVRVGGGRRWLFGRLLRSGKIQSDSRGVVKTTAPVLTVVTDSGRIIQTSNAEDVTLEHHVERISRPRTITSYRNKQGDVLLVDEKEQKE